MPIMINAIQLKDWEIGKRMNTKLKKLKKSNLEAFFYWYKIYKLMTLTKGGQPIFDCANSILPRVCIDELLY
jgi:hypothetical protein